VENNGNTSNTTNSNSESQLDSIPHAARNLLPFKEEAICQWDEKDDILAFLRALLDKDYIAIDEYGKEIKGNYSGVADGFFQNDRKVVDKWVDQFAQPGERYAQIPHRAYFDASSVFGKATKYFIAWKEIVANVLAESEFFSIVHTLEAELDISSSFLLAANLYYKQAFQVLRAYIENLVLPVYFCEYPLLPLPHMLP